MTEPDSTDEHSAAAFAVAQKIEAMAHQPIEELDRMMRLNGWRPKYRAIVLEAMARKADAAALAARGERDD